MFLFLLALLSLESVVALFLGWRPEGRIAHGGLVFLLLLWLGVFVIRFVPRLHNASRQFDANLAVLLISSLLALLLLEVASEVLLRQRSQDVFFHTRGPNIQRVFHPDPKYLPHMPDAIKFTTNAQGIRSIHMPHPDASRWLAIGGSTTECMYLDDSRTWVAQTQSQFLDEQLWVGNVGISGFDTHEHLEFIVTSPLLDDMEGIILQIGINDYWRYLAGEEERIQYNRFQTGTEAPTEKTNKESLQEPYAPYWSRPKTLLLFRDLRRAWNAQVVETTPRVTHEGIGGEEYAIRRSQREAAPIIEDLPDLSIGLERYTQRVSQIIEAARQRNLNIIFVGQPVLWHEALPKEQEVKCWFGWLADGSYLSIPALREGMDAYNKALQETW